MALNREDLEPMTGMVEAERRLVKVSMACRLQQQPSGWD